MYKLHGVLLQVKDIHTYSVGDILVYCSKFVTTTAVLASTSSYLSTNIWLMCEWWLTDG